MDEDGDVGLEFIEEAKPWLEELRQTGQTIVGFVDAVAESETLAAYQHVLLEKRRAELLCSTFGGSTSTFAARSLELGVRRVARLYCRPTSAISFPRWMSTARFAGRCSPTSSRKVPP